MIYEVQVILITIRTVAKKSNIPGWRILFTYYIIQKISGIAQVEEIEGGKPQEWGSVYYWMLMLVLSGPTEDIKRDLRSFESSRL